MPDPRSTDGELLCPALYPAARVASLKRELLRDYAAQFQQQPTTETGAHFHRAWLPVRAVRPAGAPAARCRFWDLASTKQTPGTDPDWTVGALVSRWPDGLYSIDDVVRLRDTPGVVDQTILAVTQQDGRGVRVRIPEVTTVKHWLRWSARHKWVSRSLARDEWIARTSDDQIVLNVTACKLALTTRAHDFLTANDGPNFLRAARALSVHVPPIQRVADVSERIEDLSDVPDAPREERRAI